MLSWVEERHVKLVRGMMCKAGSRKRHIMLDIGMGMSSGVEERYTKQGGGKTSSCVEERHIKLGREKAYQAE